MIYASATVPVNPHGERVITRAELWKGLVLKARDARLFLPPGLCTRCDVIGEGENYIVREATIGGADLKEIVAFEPEKKATFFQFTGPREGAIINEILEDQAGALQLRFYCLMGLRNAPPGSPEEREEQATMDSEDRGYKPALLSTLARIRQLLGKGEL